MFGLEDRHINFILNILKNNFSGTKFYIFGSRAKGTYRTGSDIDFAVWTDKQDSFFRIAGELDDLPTPYKFDVIDYKNLSHEGMKNSIDRYGIVFYKREIL